MLKNHATFGIKLIVHEEKPTLQLTRTNTQFVFVSVLTDPAPNKF